MMLADTEVKTDEHGYPVVHIEKGCCEWVDNTGLVEIK